MACTLSLVSRNLRNISAPFLLQTASVNGIPRLQAFLKKLNSLPTTARRVRSLFLEDTLSHNPMKYSKETRVEC